MRLRKEKIKYSDKGLIENATTILAEIFIAQVDKNKDKKINQFSSNSSPNITKIAGGEKKAKKYGYTKNNKIP